MVLPLRGYLVEEPSEALLWPVAEADPVMALAAAAVLSVLLLVLPMLGAHGAATTPGHVAVMQSPPGVFDDEGRPTTTGSGLARILGGIETLIQTNRRYPPPP